MGMTLAQTIVTRAATLLQDPGYIRWTAPELLDYLNAGQRAVVGFKPNAYTKNVALALAAGTKQSLPTDALGLIDVPRNLGTDGATPGAAVRMARREILDTLNPNWHASTPSAVVKHFCFSSLDVKHFYVYPPQPATGTGQVEIVYPAVPADVALTDPILLDDIYEEPLLNYTLFRAYSKDTEYAANAQAAEAYMSAFKELLSGKTAGESSTNPNASASGNPNA